MLNLALWFMRLLTTAVRILHNLRDEHFSA